MLKFFIFNSYLEIDLNILSTVFFKFRFVFEMKNQSILIIRSYLKLYIIYLRHIGGCEQNVDNVLVLRSGYSFLLRTAEYMVLTF